MSGRGAAHARCGRLAEGLAQLDAAVEGARTMGRFGRLPLMLVKCGEIHLLAGDTAAAVRLANDALERASAQRELGNQVYARLLLAQCDAADSGQAADALYVEALKLATQLGMWPLAAHCHAGLWRLHVRFSGREKAQPHLTAATTMYREMAMRFWLEAMERDAASLP